MPCERAGLKLTARIEPTSIVSGDPCNLVAILTNTSDKSIEVFKPQHYDIESLGNWRIVEPGDTTRRPWVPQFQSVEAPGIQGEIIHLAPGESWEIRNKLTHFDIGKHWTCPAPIPPGTYILSYFYEKTDNGVPYRDENWRGQARVVEGLWTGQLQSTGVSLTVTPSPKPSILITETREAYLGEPCPIRVTITNPGPEALRWEGAWMLTITSKGGIKGTGRFKITPHVAPLADDTFTTLELSPCESFEFTLDVSTLPLHFEVSHRLPGQRPIPSSGTIEDVYEGYSPTLRVAFADQDDKPLLESNWLYTVLRYRQTTTSRPTPQRITTTGVTR